MIALMLTVSVSAGLLGNIIKKLYAKTTSNGMICAYTYSTCSAALASVLILIWGGIGEVSLYTLITAIIFGAMTSSLNLFNLMAVKTGPISYTTVICSFSTLISALSGVFFFDETPKLTQIIGMALMLVSFLLAIEKGNNEKKTSVKWLVLCIICFFLQGGIGIMQKIHQTSPHKAELNAFLVIAFAVAFLISGLLMLWGRLHGARILSADAPKKSIVSVAVCLALAGVFVGINNKLNLYLSGVMNSAVFFPVMNGSVLVLTTSAAVVIFRERLSRRQWIGIVIGIVAVLLLFI